MHIFILSLYMHVYISGTIPIYYGSLDITKYFNPRAFIDVKSFNSFEGTCVFVRMHAQMYVCMHVCMYKYMHICMYVCICICTCMYVCMYVCIYVCMYACMHVRIDYLYITSCEIIVIFDVLSDVTLVYAYFICK